MISANTRMILPYVSTTHTPGELGEVRVINGDLMVYNGSWVRIYVHTETFTDYETNELLTWVKNKIAQEKKENELAKQFPALARAKENYDMIRRLVENEVV